MMASFNTCSGLQLAGVSACTDVCSSREVDAPGAPPLPPSPPVSAQTHGQENVRRWKFSSLRCSENHVGEAVQRIIKFLPASFP